MYCNYRALVILLCIAIAKDDLFYLFVPALVEY